MMEMKAPPKPPVFPKVCEAGELAREMEAAGIAIGADRLVELAEAGYMPSVTVDGKGPLFLKTQAKQWIIDHLIVRNEARPFPTSLRVIDPTAVPAPASDMPPCLAPMAGYVWEIPQSHLVRGGAVYFLVRGAEVVYVGQSVTINARIATHLGVGRVEFDRVFYVHVPDSELDAVEAAFIRVFQPPMNSKLRRPELPGDRELIRGVCGWEPVGTS